jgi:integrase/recombinase XerC
MRSPVPTMVIMAGKEVLKPHPDQHFIDAFAAHLLARGSPRTRAAYVRDAQVLLTTCGAELPLSSITPHDIRRTIAKLHSKNLSGRSLARMLSAWRGMFAFLRETAPQVFTTDPCAGLRAPKSPKRLPAALTPEEAAKFVQIEGETHANLRDRAIVELLYSSGLRISECTGLDLNRLDLKNAEARVIGKGNKERIVPVGAKAITALEAWLAARATIAAEHQATDAHAVFINDQGARIAVRTVQQRMKSLSITQGMQESVHPHRLRHSFASHVLQSSGDLRAVQEMMGHASIASTQVYTHLDFQHLAKVYDAAHPRAKRK